VGALTGEKAQISWSSAQVNKNANSSVHSSINKQATSSHHPQAYSYKQTNNVSLPYSISTMWEQYPSLRDKTCTQFHYSTHNQEFTQAIELQLVKQPKKK
jgi:hypothetical protein